ncbi:glycosyltransferase [Paracoccus denitrificans]|jgi:glycosyltransferase involved in cell wall biosynthesis|uniref:Glycosyl transferase, group 1 n=1 Tax=Paracoccus denitrificans (strain Pd 1222) TaxID=318586 RepID=A1B306_PARDP|nr:glycosyltransferase [Paracoccus denitrificans]ABL69900.1 glycosyl transferase, group 1 [Paracoccus denitrificans PD1222]MBB4626980.1 glycosyltransferase involved in cell wall biosynthesis [Paracoccus denitrificans]MCU7428366.1 glycosyltransferase [Paracoccus denitrificans]QAR25289.1 glycosyltransferase [Paracoccus denitrificans]UPV94172.1 glycosyltransferase [Paracoccus denitrificans]
MKILFVHQNFPAQFLHLAPALAARGHHVMSLTDEKNPRPSPVRVVRYKTPPELNLSPMLGRTYSEMAERGWLAARGCRALRDRHDYTPDLIFGHSGWGETLFLREIWPDAKLLVYAELMYRTRGHDVGFDPEISPDSDEARVNTVARSAHLIQGLVQADAGLAPTRYQADSFPPELRRKLTVIHDGIDTVKVCPNPLAEFPLPDGRKLRAGDEVLTYVSRSLEPYRGFHRFMRALPEVLRARPNAQVVLVGGEGVSYGGLPKDAAGWKEKLLAELDGQLDLSRVHFMGRVPYPQYLALLQVSRVHCYLTYPFVLSWSLTEAMAAGCYVVGSDTEPVRELVRDGKNGRLVPFFDQSALEVALIRGLAGDPDAARLQAAARETILQGYDLHRHSLPQLVDWVESFAS